MAGRDIVTTQEAAQLSRVTTKTIRQWIREGLPTVERGKAGGNRTSRIDLRALYQWHLDHVPQDPLDAARTRLAREQADKQALDNAHRRGEFGLLRIWREELETMFSEFRASLLAMPTKEAPQLDGDVNQRKGHLERVARQLLTYFSTYGLAGPARRKANGANGSARPRLNGAP
jgi:phage terminase Nu1 subunit (DNA packaging protein)